MTTTELFATLWSPDKAREWQKFFESPVGRDGLMMLIVQSRVPADGKTVIPGTDQKVLAEQAFSFHSGQSSVIDSMIHDLFPKPEPKPSPTSKPFQTAPRPTS